MLAARIGCVGRPVADDNAVNLKVACATLLKLGYDIHTAVDGREAVDAVAQTMARGPRFGAVLMDVNMPELGGLQATQQIQAAWGAQAPPIIALTAVASAEDRLRCEAAGMDDYLTKPLQVAALALALEKWVPARLPDAINSVACHDQSMRAEAQFDAQEESLDALQNPLMDFSRLNEFREFDDEDLSMTREVVSLFVNDAPQRLQAIAAAVAANDAQALSRAAHALKGAASNVGAVAMHAVCIGLEAESQVPADALARVDQLHDLWQKTRFALEKWA